MPDATSSIPPALERVWVVGCGAMGGILLARWLLAGLDPLSVTVIDPAPDGLPAGFSGAVVPDPAVARAKQDAGPTLVVLGIKPQALAGVAPDLLTAFGAARPLVLSMLAGVRTAALSQMLPGARIVRIMPNLPARIGRGATAMFAAGAVDDHGSDADRAAIDWLMAATGSAVWLDDESRFDAVTGLSGSGPAYLFRFIEALAGAGEAAGLDPETAAWLALETVTGAAELAATSAASPAELRQQVTSPNGTTQAGLDILDGDGALSSLLRATVRAAAERSRALAAAAEASAETPILRDPLRVN